MYGNPNLPDIIKSQTVTVTAASTASAAFSAGTEAVTVWCTALCWLKFGGNPTAAATAGDNIPIPANALVSIPVSGGEKIAAILPSAGTETLYLWEHANV